ncbi:L,D-transpeptidase family protein [Fluviispira vulneris]|uniref:L,D-transpeptidase family protein n=1 Tax=Fluviispira vulneris TaxID=2763012 RepID=UPI00164545A8|nr:L,D-transpeptidase family protein [Fluviispira vulneris]
MKTKSYRMFIKFIVILFNIYVGNFAFAEKPFGQASVTALNGIPSSFISLGAYHPTYAMVVEKNFHRLSVFKLLPDGNYTLVRTYLAITGKEQGDKKHRGDNRTPEGIYFIVGQKDSSELLRQMGPSARKYGPRAFMLDYPNIFDKRQRKTGSGIWIHGVDSDARMLRPFDTEGCVALKNEDIIDIAQYVSAFQTPVVIVDEMQTISMAAIQKQRQNVIEMVEAWRKSWENSDFAKYISFYSDHFQSLGKNKEDWREFKAKLSETRKGSITVQISEPKILAFRNQLLVEFFQKYSSPEKDDFGRKFLYLRQEDHGFKIIAEKWYNSQKGKTDLTVLNDTKKRQD